MGGHCRPTASVAQSVTAMVSVEGLNSASRTLVLPLYYRAVERGRPDPIVQDPIAADLPTVTGRGACTAGRMTGALTDVEQSSRCS